ncbi:YlbF family regulator [Virgibacillus soli]|uniref:YlbF family regulator n=1 Tax=Paracerasibacillus soli TaxID=480284 RepID=A0ABU5CP02_9BACI|nr:YlbF family regulator [Virgibacillus soli]MDY0408082.1 YlbF family regulator [Virgibacillus soli]
MIATLEFADVLDRSEILGNIIRNSEVMHDYHQAKEELQLDKEAQELIQAFNYIKEDYEDIQRFGRYHPDYNQIMKKIRATKREMDMHPTVAAFKVAERSLQQFLDEISEIIACSVSEEIKVPKDGAALSDGGCGSGGSCGCKVS